MWSRKAQPPTLILTALLFRISIRKLYYYRITAGKERRRKMSKISGDYMGFTSSWTCLESLIIYLRNSIEII